MSKPRNTLSGTRRRLALEAVGYRCEGCGWEGEPDERGRFSGLEVHHRDGNHNTPHDHRPENLQVLCNPCHAGGHGTKPKQSRAAVLRQAVEEMARREGVS
jgi:hypothetical protein